MEPDLRGSQPGSPGRLADERFDQGQGLVVSGQSLAVAA